MGKTARGGGDRARASTASPRATVCALLGLECVVYMGTEDMARQAPNVRRMRLLGAEVRGVDSGSRTLKDAINEAMRDWVTNVRTTHYLLGSVLGAHPYPMMVRDFQSVIGEEARAQFLGPGGRRSPTCSWPAWAAARTRSASSSRSSRTTGSGWSAWRRAAARAEPGDHAARFLGEGAGVGVLQGTRTYLLQDEAGNVLPTHSVSAGLDYPAVGPEHALLRDEGRVRYDVGRRRRGPGRLPPARPRPRASCPRSSPRTPWPGCCGEAAVAARAERCS